MIKIHDIKPIVVIPDLSIYLYYAVILLFLLVLIFITYKLYHFFKPKIKTQEMIWYESLQNIDFKDSKKAAYKITKYGNNLAKEDRQIRLIEELNSELSRYKYKKDISQEINQEIKTKFSIFMDTLDVK